MKLIIDYLIKNRIMKETNLILERSLEIKKTEDKIIGIITREISGLILRVINQREEL
jgi:hypothetical protein